MDSLKGIDLRSENTPAYHDGGGDGPHARLEEDGDHAEELLTVKQQHDHVSNNHFSFQMVATDRERAARCTTECACTWPRGRLPRLSNTISSNLLVTLSSINLLS